MGKLNNIDKAAAGKGSGINTLWQFVKFIVVSLGACIVQVASLAILYNIPAIKALSTQAFHWFVFDYPVIEGQRTCALHCIQRFQPSAADSCILHQQGKDFQLGLQHRYYSAHIHNLHPCSRLLLCVVQPRSFRVLHLKVPSEQRSFAHYSYRCLLSSPVLPLFPRG